jgi:hypothetical protein
MSLAGGGALARSEHDLHQALDLLAGSLPCFEKILSVSRMNLAHYTANP